GVSDETSHVDPHWEGEQTVGRTTQRQSALREELGVGCVVRVGTKQCAVVGYGSTRQVLTVKGDEHWSVQDSSVASGQHAHRGRPEVTMDDVVVARGKEHRRVAHSADRDRKSTR